MAHLISEHDPLAPVAILKDSSSVRSPEAFSSHQAWLFLPPDIFTRLPPLHRLDINTRIAVQLPPFTALAVSPIPALAENLGISVLPAIVTNGYIDLVVQNNSLHDVLLFGNMKIAILSLTCVLPLTFVVADTSDPPR